MRNFVRVVGLWAASLASFALLVWGVGGPQLVGRGAKSVGAPPASLAQKVGGDARATRRQAWPHAPRDGGAPERRAPVPDDEPAAVGPYAGAVRRGPLQDDARLLAAPEREALLAELRRVAARTGVQLAVWTAPPFADGSLTERSLAKAEALRLGNQGKDDGLLLSLAPAAREARLEVGYGLEGVLPDAACAQILRRAFAGAADHGAGGAQLLAAVEAVRGRLEAAVADGSLAPPERRPDRPEASDGPPLWPYALALLLVLYLLGRGGGGGRGRGRRTFGVPAWPFLGGGLGGGSWPSAGTGRPSDDTRGGGGTFGGGGASSRW